MIYVAAQMRQDAFALMHEPLWQVLYVFHHLMEREERDNLRRRFERVDAGVMTSLAFNQPSALSDEMTAVQDAIRALDKPADVSGVNDSLRAKAEALAARIEVGEVLSDGALVQ